jgi:hypothetical protein
MKTRTILAALVAFVAGLAIAQAADISAHMGTWKLNEAKSKFNAGATKNHTVTYTQQGDSVKVVVDGKDKDGKAVHNEWVGKFDGKDYPVTGSDLQGDARSYSVADDHTLNMTVKSKGKVLGTGTIKVAADGKSRTVDTTSADPKTPAFTATAVYDKQ